LSTQMFLECIETLKKYELEVQDLNSCIINYYCRMLLARCNKEKDIT